tara:strand:- start:4 stop:459 length:456 start_codon:yes stop_codon:yes gene_type:complete
MNNQLRFILINVLIIIFFFFLAFYVKQKKQKKLSFYEFINGGKKLPSIKNLSIGLIFGVIFGFIDNLGLWFGMDNFTKNIKGGPLLKAGIGNTYSDFIGSIIGTLISSIAMDLFKYDNNSTPIWINTVGIVIGCLLGIFVGKTLTTQKSLP